MFKLVLFYTQGIPFDEGIDLTKQKDMMVDKYHNVFDEIIIYTPDILHKLGYGSYVKKYEEDGVINMNPGYSKIGFGSWKPMILNILILKS